MAIEDKKKSEKNQTDHKVENFFNQIPPKTKNTFTSDQKKEVKKLIKRMMPVNAKKLMDIRFTFWFIKRIFAVIFIGVSKRKKERTSNMSRLQRFLALEFKIVFYIFEFALCIVILLFVLYLLKVLFKFNIIERLF